MRTWIGIGIVLAVAACGAPPADPPTAVIHAEPDSVCSGDGHRTVIALDGRDSMPALSLVPAAPDPAAPPLLYRWSFGGSAYRIVDGGPDQPTLSLTMAADRPLHVQLGVRNAGGGSSSSLLTIPITRPHADDPDGCAPENLP